MAKLITLANLTKFSTELKSKYAKKTDLVPLQNKIETVQVNGTALEIANKIVNILIASGDTNGTIKVNNVEVAIQGLAALAFKANVSESDLVEALATKITNKADKTYVDGLVSSVYKPAGSVAFDALPALSAAVLGNVYNVTGKFTTTADFVEGAGKSHGAGTNVVVVNTGTTEEPVYKFDVLAGFVDLSDYETAATAEGKYVAKNGTDRLMTEAEGTKLGQIAEQATKVEASATNGNIKINGTETTVYTLPSDVLKSADIEAVTDAEITDLLADDDEED